MGLPFLFLEIRGHFLLLDFLLDLCSLILETLLIHDFSIRAVTLFRIFISILGVHILPFGGEQSHLLSCGIFILQGLKFLFSKYVLFTPSLLLSLLHDTFWGRIVEPLLNDLFGSRYLFLRLLLLILHKERIFR